MKPFVAKAALVLLPVLAFSSQGYACQESAGANEQQAVEMNSRALQAKKPSLYNLRSGHCQVVSSADTDGAVMDFMPVDEEWQGLYENYRAKGEEPLQALEHVYKFMAGSHA